MNRIRLVMLTTMVCMIFSSIATAANWNDHLFGANQNVWQKRITIQVQNTTDTDIVGKPLACLIGLNEDQIPLQGTRIEALRVCDNTGRELLYNVFNTAGQSLHVGLVPPNATFYFPASVPAKQSREFVVYFDNPSAMPSSEFLAVKPKDDLLLQNGNMEQGDKIWLKKNTDKVPQDGKLEIVKDVCHAGQFAMHMAYPKNTPKTWAAYYQSIKPISPALIGTEITVTAFVKGQNVNGLAGFYVHVISNEGKLIYNKVVSAGNGEYDWKKIQHTFIVPKQARRITIGSMLYGSGEIWLDDFVLSSTQASKQQPLRAHFSAIENLQLTWDHPKPVWPSRFADDPNARAVALTLINHDSDPLLQTMASVNLNPYLCRGFRNHDYAVYDGHTKLKSYHIDNQLLVACSVAPQTAKTVYLYYIAHPFEKPTTIEQAKQQLDASRQTDQSTLGSDVLSDQIYKNDTSQSISTIRELVASSENMLDNPDFEITNSPAWTASTEGTVAGHLVMEITKDQPIMGKQCAHLKVDTESKNTWNGWRQSVRVEPGEFYMVSACIRSHQLQGNTTGYLHFLNDQKQIQNTARFGTPTGQTTDWTLLSSIVRIPRHTTTLQVHLTTNLAGEVWYDAAMVLRVSDVLAGPITKRQTDDAISVWPVNSIVKVFEDSLTSDIIESLNMQMAGNEQESLQVAMRSSKAIDSVTASVQWQEQKLPMTIRVLGLVPVAYQSAYTRSGANAWERKRVSTQGNTDGWPGYWPDPLFPKSQLKLQANRTRAFWLTFSTTAQTPTGTYVGQLILRNGDRILKQLPLTVTVNDFDLPKTGNVQAIYDLRVGSKWLTKDRTREDVNTELTQILADNRISPDRVPASPIFKFDGNHITADFTQYDKMADWYFNKLGIQIAYMPRFFYSFGWGKNPKTIFGLKPYGENFDDEMTDRSQLDPQYKHVYQQCLKLFWQHVQSKGWADRLILYISDEPHYSAPHIIKQMQAICDMVHEVDRSIRIYCSPWKYIQAWDGYIDIFGVAHYTNLPKLDAQSSASFWYTTDGQLCIDTPYCGFERMMPYFCFRYNVPVYEFWGASWLTLDPYQFGWHAFINQSDKPGHNYSIQYPNGDGYLLYPGALAGYDKPVSSIRFEQVRDGLEDSQYLFLLQQAIKQASDAGQSTAHAQQVLDLAKHLVQSPNAGGRFSTRFLPNPDMVPILRQWVSQAITQLQSH